MSFRKIDDDTAWRVVRCRHREHKPPSMIVLLPHLGSATRETREAMGRLALDNLVAFFSGRDVPNQLTSA